MPFVLSGHWGPVSRAFVAKPSCPDTASKTFRPSLVVVCGAGLKGAARDDMIDEDNASHCKSSICKYWLWQVALWAWIQVVDSGNRYDSLSLCSSLSMRCCICVDQIQ